MKALLQTIFLSVLLGLFSAPLLADESMCDVLDNAGVTPGLFGLCNAYCDAKDCDENAPEDMPRSCDRLLANYNNKRDPLNPLDEEMPCLPDDVAVCPCWPTGAELVLGPGTPGDLPPNPGGFGCVSMPGVIEAASYQDPENVPPFVSFFVDIEFSSCDYMANTDNGVVMTMETGLNESEIVACAADVQLLHDEDFGGCE